jgi:hypothetical protein
MAEWCRKFQVDIRVYCLMPDQTNKIAIPAAEMAFAGGCFCVRIVL